MARASILMPFFIIGVAVAFLGGMDSSKVIGLFDGFNDKING